MNSTFTISGKIPVPSKLSMVGDEEGHCQGVHGDMDRLVAGWYRIRMQSACQSGPDGAALAFQDGRDEPFKVMHLPFGVNGQLDHIFFLPFLPKRLCFLSRRADQRGKADTVTFDPISTPTAYWLMAGRLLHYLQREGSLSQLALVEDFGSPKRVALSQARTCLDRTYQRIKLRMLLRSLPLADYARWRELHMALTEIDGSGHSLITVIIDRAGQNEEAVQTTRDSIVGQVRQPAGVLIANSSDTPLLNDVFDAVQTPFVWVVQAGDRLASFALALIAKQIAKVPDVQCVYGDEDGYDEHGNLVQPIFKPEFDPVLQAASDYVGRTRIISKEHARSGAISGVESRFIACIPHVLLHCPASEKRFPTPALAPRGHTQPKVSIIIPTRDNVSVLQPCIESVLGKTEYPDLEVIVVDNGSCEPQTMAYLEQLRLQRNVRCIRADIPFNYSKLNNIGVEQAVGDILIFLNDDVEVIESGWLSAMVAWALQPGIGAVGARLLYSTGRIQHAGLVLGLVGVAGHPWKGVDPQSGYADFRLRYPRTVSANTGACLAVRREHFESVGGLDEFLAVAFNDVDLCLKLQQEGLRNVWTPDASLIHHESVSRGRNDTPEKRRQFEREKKIMRKRWGDQLKSDPYYNPNLTYDVEDGGLALFPRYQERL